MGPNDTFRKYLLDRRVAADLAVLPVFGATAYLLFRASSALRPLEAAGLMMIVAALVLFGRRWLSWQHGLVSGGFLTDWSQRILRGEREPVVAPPDLAEEGALAAAALNAVIAEGQRVSGELARLRQAILREWRDLDDLLDGVQRQQAADHGIREAAEARLGSLGQDLQQAVERALSLEHIELTHRLRADQHRFQGRAFRTALDQVQTGLDQFGDLQEDLRSTFTRLRREEEALGRLADTGLRQGARLGLAVKGLAAHTPRLLEETRARTEQLRRFRQSADGVRDQAEALSRRLEAFRTETQGRIRSFGGAQGSLQVIDRVAQQTGLLAVNMAILAQQGTGGAGLQAIGGRLRSLADQTAEGAHDLERAMDQHQQGMDREVGGLWDLKEVTEHLMSGIQEFLHTAGHLDQQGQSLERALETHLGMVDQVRQASERTEIFLHEVGERAESLETILGRQWAVEARMAPELERLARINHHLSEAGEDLAQASQQNIDEIWEILGRHQELRRQEAYRTVVSGGLADLFGPGDRTGVWEGVLRARAERRGRRLSLPEGVPPPFGWSDAWGNGRLLLLGVDPLGRPEPSALEGWSCDATGQAWQLRLLEPLRTEHHRLALLETLKESPLCACLPGVDLRISAEGAEVLLATPYPGLPAFLAGLRLELSVDAGSWQGPLRDPVVPQRPVQRFLWVGPDVAPDHRLALVRLIHSWVRDDQRHEGFMLGFPYAGHRPPCPWLSEGETDAPLEGRPRIRCLGLDADPSVLHPLRDRLIQAGAAEGDGEATLCAVGLGHAHPEALLLRLFQTGAGLADSAHPDLVPYRSRLQVEVLGGMCADPYGAAWLLLEDLQCRGWALPLPPA